MASNINKAFMRAYAKDRPVSAEDTTTPGTPVAGTAPVAVHAPADIGMPAAVHQPVAVPTHVPASTNATTTSPVISTSRIPPVAQPSMEPTVFAGRFAPSSASVAQPKAAIVQPTAPAPKPAQAPMSAPASPMSASPTSVPAVQSTIRNTHRIPAPGIQTKPPQTRAVPTNTAPTNVESRNSGRPLPQPTAQPRPVPQQPVPQQPVAQALPARIEKTQELDSGEASRVWQRIDAAHGAQATHPTETQARPTVAVGATRTATPKRAQATAPAPVAPAPVAVPQMRIDSPTTPGARQLPLVGDEANAPAEPQQAESRRRTVADFLYSAGQYNPGRVLASAEPVDMAVATTTAAPSIAAATSMRSTEMVRPLDRSMERSMAPGVESSLNSHPDMSGVQTSEPMVAPMHPMTMPATQEPMPRRMGQILRVDVPRNHSDAAAMPATVAPPAAPAAMPTPMPASAPVQALPAQSMDSQPMPMQSMQPAPPMAASIDAPVAKYVLEQRRIDRAHKLNEAEEKLRHITHKVFNPVWEVDNLQWPVVVDKLMQQRAQSMSHVAEHLKAACQDGLSVLGVTSADKGEGRTTVACCLARLAAAHGLKVALVDIDLDHPTLCVQTNMEVENDWRDCLSEDVSLEEVSVHSIDDQLTVLPLKPRGGRPGLLASDSRIADILNDLSECFELVIVDCCKINSSGNIITGLAHTKIFDAAIVVVDRRDGQADRVEDAVRMIQQTGIESIGIVDNFSM